MEQEETKTPALTASESNKTIISSYNKDVNHLEELKQVAVRFVSNGHPIVPMGFNKVSGDYKLPLIRWREDGPLKTQTEVEDTFTKLGGKVFGIATIVEGYILVDFDTKDTNKLFQLEPVPTIQTGKGYHMWYQADETIIQNGPVDLSEFEKRDSKKYQMEVYTNSRLEVIPPSLHHSGVKYEWVVPLDDFLELPQMPRTIADLCSKKEKNKDFLTKTVVEGSRHSAIVKVATHYSRLYAGNKSKIEKEVKNWNEACCMPPLNDDEIENVITWVVDTYKDIGKDKKPTKSNRVQVLIDGDASITLFHDQNKTGYARIKTKNRQINVPISSPDFMDCARYKLYKETGETVSDIQLKEAFSLLNARAIYESEMHELNYRVAQGTNNFYYDLLNERGEVVCIDEDGWRIIPNDDVPFLFKTGTGKEQKTPERGGDLRDLLGLININDEDEQMLYICTLPVRLIRNVDQAIIYVHGSAGSGKTTLLKMTKDLLDPSKGGISMPLRKVEQAEVLFNQTWVFANDNVSKINEDLSNFFCVAVTGAESSKRKLYSDSDISILTVKNPAYITGINVEAYKSDLLSRILILKTDAINEGGRRSSQEIYQRFEELRPKLLGALFETLSKAIKVKKTLPQKTEYRLADFALWGAACAEVLGYGANRFEEALQRSIKYRSYEALYVSSAGRAVIELMRDCVEFEGTMTELLKELKNLPSSSWGDEYDHSSQEIIANNPSSLGKKLRELENSFTSIGIILDFGRRNSLERKIVIKKTRNIEV